MSIRRRNQLIVALFGIAISASAWAQEQAPPEANPEALKAFTELVKAYRERPALTVKSTVKIEAADGDTKSSGSEIKAEFTFGQHRNAIVKLRGFTVYLNNDGQKADSGTISAIHEGTDHSYFTSSDDGSPYYALLTNFKDMPFPVLAIELGEDAIDDVLLQLHPKALNGLVPTAVATKEDSGKSMQMISFTGENEQLEMAVEPDSKLIQSAILKITGGSFVQPGSTLVYRNTYEYQTYDKPLDPSTFKLDPGQRQRVDLMLSLLPKTAPLQPAGDGEGDGEPAANALVGKPAPAFTLATADGKAVDLHDLQGKVVVLDFWASWCGPCMAALPKLHEVAKWVSKEQIPATVMTINVWEIHNKEADSPDARLASAKQTWEKRGFTLPILMDYSDETAGAYGVSGIPTTVIIRSDGVVHAVHVGASADYVEDLKREIQDAIKAVE